MNELMGLFDGDDARERSPSTYQDGPADVATDAGEPEEDEEDEEDEDEEDEEDEEEEETDFDLSELRPVKRSRAAAADSQALPAPFGPGSSVGTSSRSDRSSSRRARGSSSDSGAVEKDDGMEVIEILSDEEDSHSSPAYHGQMFFQNAQFANRYSARGREDRTADDVARGAAAAAASAGRGGGGAAAARSSHHARDSDDRQGARERNSPHTWAGGKGLKMAAARHGVGRGSSRKLAVRSSSARKGTVVPPPGGSEEDEEGEGEEEAWGKPSADEVAAAVTAAGNAAAGVGDVGSGEARPEAAVGEASLKIGSADDDGDGATASGGQVGGRTGSTNPSAAAAAPAPVPGELPLNLECVMCFNPLAIVALFACGHGSCWECAHEWCSRETSLTMDCPTCHVSVPRNDFRRCVVLDQVVERAVIAAGMDDDDWRKRLDRGQKLSREAEASRRGSRDAQRAAEDIITEQAAELERLREEAKSRAAQPGGRRAWRSYDGSPPSMADYGFRLMNGSGGNGGGGGGNNGGGRDFLDQASHRSTVPESTRFRHRRGEVGDTRASSSRGARTAAGEAAAAAAAALGISPSGAAYGGGLRSRAHAHRLSSAAASAAAAAAAASGFGPPEGEPWFSLRPSQPSRQSTVAMSMSAGRADREAFSRGTLPGRSHGHSAAGSGAMSMGLDQSAGAVWSQNERVSGGGGGGGGSGSNWRSAYLNGGGLPLSASGGSTRSPTVTNSRATQFRLGGQGAAVDRLSSGMGDHHMGQALSGRPTRKRYSLRGLEAGGGGGGGGGGDRGAAARSGSPSSSPPSFQQAGGAGFAPPGLQFGSLGDRHGRREQQQQQQQQHNSRGGGGGGAGGSGGYNLQFVNRNHGRPAPLQQAPSPMLDLEDLMSGQEDTGSRSEWDDVLAAVSMPLQAAEDGLGRAGSPGATRGLR